MKWYAKSTCIYPDLTLIVTADLITQDDLAEHVIHSPVWQEHDASDETAEVWSDWEYYSDDYYDEESPKKKRHAPEGIGGSNDGFGNKRKIMSSDHTRRKRRRVQKTEDIPPFSLDNAIGNDCTVVSHSSGNIRWKEKDIGSEIPIFSDNQIGKIALLKDWRDRFKVPVHKDGRPPSVVEQISSPKTALKSRSENGVSIKHNLKADLKEQTATSRAKSPLNKTHSSDDPIFKPNLSKANEIAPENSGLSSTRRLSRKRALDDQESSQIDASQATNNSLTQLSGEPGPVLHSKKRKSEDEESGSRSATKSKLQDFTPDGSASRGSSLMRRSKRLRPDYAAGN